MVTRFFTIFAAVLLSLPVISTCQYVEKVSFDSKDSTNGYYLVIQPRSKSIKGALVLFTSFYQLDDILAETKLHNTAYANDLLTIVVSLKDKFLADTATIDRMNTILNHIVQHFPVDNSKFVFAGFDIPGNIILRYTELAYEHPAQYKIQPKAVLAVDCAVDLFGLWHWSERAIKKNYNMDDVGSAKYILDIMTKANGTIYNNPANYLRLSPFAREAQTTGHEQYLKNVAVRLYYDTDIDWQLKNKRNGFYDTNIPDGSELINRLLLLGNNNAEFIVAKQPGIRSNGIRSPTSLSIVNEVECIQWIKRKLDIFDANTWIPPYDLSIPNGWGVERFSFPIEFASKIPYKGVEDLRFTPGWGDAASEEHWSYTYLWWLEGNPKIDAGALQENLEAYYSGLVGRNITRRNIPKNKLVPTTAAIKKIKTSPNDAETYIGTISMLNYLAQQPMVLQCLIHVKSCKEQDHTAVFIEVSPKYFEHPVWHELNKIEESFDCKEK